MRAFKKTTVVVARVECSMTKKVNELLTLIAEAASAYDATEVENLARQIVETMRENIAAHPKAFVRELREAARQFDRQQAEALCKKLVSSLRTRTKPYPLVESKNILNILRRKRYFDLMTKVADVFIQTGRDESTIRRQYAQALLDQGYISAALDVLAILEQHCIEAGDESELAETRGLIGRARKQIYMNKLSEERPNAALKRNFEQAVTAYSDVYKKTKGRLWHGINTVALLDRAKRDRLRLPKGLQEYKSIAKDILQQISAKKKIELWDYATAGEASLALKDYQQALQWILEYTRENTRADAFEYASTLRQFEEVWKLDEGKKEQAQILHLLRSSLLRQEGGQIEIANTEQKLATANALEADKEFEQILGKDRFQTFQWYRTGLDRATDVAKICDRSDNPAGSGFLVAGKDVHERIDEKWLLVTNAHVISDDYLEQNATPAALPSDEARIRFEAQDPNQVFEVEEIIYSSPRSELDCTIARLRSYPDHSYPYPIAKRLPLLNKNQRVYVIGHPGGRRLSYSINDNLLLDYEKPKVHYRAPTEGGSSGSPVFNQQWDLLALHHAGGRNTRMLNGQFGTYPANEGLFFQSILNAVAGKLG